MANAVKGEASAKLKDGRALTLAYDFNTLVEAEDALPGENMAAVLKELEAKEGDEPTMPRLKVFRALVWAGLRRHHAAIDLAEAGNLIGTDGEAIGAAMITGMASAFDSGRAAAADDAEPDPIKKG